MFHPDTLAYWASILRLFGGQSFAVESFQSNSGARQAVILFGELGKLLADFRRQLLTQFPTDAAETRVECKNYESGPVVEVWAELTRSQQEPVVWWMDITPHDDDLWSIAAEVSISGRDTVHEIEPVNGLSFEQLRDQAPRMLRGLLELHVP